MFVRVCEYVRSWGWLGQQRECDTSVLNLFQCVCLRLMFLYFFDPEPTCRSDSAKFFLPRVLPLADPPTLFLLSTPSLTTRRPRKQWNNNKKGMSKKWGSRLQSGSGLRNVGSVTVVTPFLLVGFLPHVVRSGVPLNRGKLQLSSLANRLYPKKINLKKSSIARRSFLIYTLCIFFMYVILPFLISRLSSFFLFFYLNSICHAYTTYFPFRHVTFLPFSSLFSKNKKEREILSRFVSLFTRLSSVSLALISLPTGETFPFRFRLSNVSKFRGWKVYSRKSKKREIEKESLGCAHRIDFSD